MVHGETHFEEGRATLAVASGNDSGHILLQLKLKIDRNYWSRSWRRWEGIGDAEKGNDLNMGTDTLRLETARH